MCDLYPLTFYFVSRLRLNFLIFDFLSLLVSCVSCHISTESQMPISPFTPFLNEASVYHRLMAILGWKFDLEEISPMQEATILSLVFRLFWSCGFVGNAMNIVNIFILVVFVFSLLQICCHVFS